MTQFDMPPARTLPEHRRTAMRRQLETVVTGGPRRRRPLLIAASAAVVAAGTSAGAYAYVQHSQPVTDKSQARCYTVASLSAGPERTGEAHPRGGIAAPRLPGRMAGSHDHRFRRRQ